MTALPLTPLTPRHIALVAHDNMKAELLRWADHNRQTLSQHVLYATGTTGTMLEFELGLPVHRFLSTPTRWPRPELQGRRPRRGDDDVHPRPDDAHAVALDEVRATIGTS